MERLLWGWLLGLFIAVFIPRLSMLLLFFLWIIVVIVARRMPTLWVVPGLVCGVAVGQGGAVGPELDGYVHVRGRVCSVVGRSEVSLCAADWKVTGGDWKPTMGRVSVVVSRAPLSLGTNVVVAGWALPAQTSVLPGAPDYGQLRLRAGIRSRIIAHDVAAVAGWSRPSRERSAGSGLLWALATGDRSLMPASQVALFRQTGTAHLMAVSGLHVGLVGWLVSGLMRLCCRPFVLIKPQGVPLGLSATAGVVAVVAYTGLVGAPASACRAALMFCAWSLLSCWGRRPDPRRCLLLVGVALTIVDPMAMARVSVQLSFGAVLGICVIYPRLIDVERWGSGGPLAWCLRSVCISLSAMLGTLPAVAWWFQEIAVWGPLANLLAIPIVSFCLVPCALLVHASPIGAWWPILRVADNVEWLLITGLECIPQWVCHPAVGCWGAVGLAVVLFLPNRIETIILLLTLIIGLIEQPTQRRVEVLDVGQGSAALIHVPATDPLLLDGGPSRTSLLALLRRRRIHRLRAVIASHGDSDHINGLFQVIQSLTVDELWVGGLGKADRLREEAARRSIPVYGCESLRNRSLPVDLWCDRAPTSENDASLVIQAGGVVLLGDLSSIGEAKMMEEFPINASVVVLGHHGSKASTAPQTLHRLQPRVAIASAALRNRYGHPHQEVRDRLHLKGIPLLSTAEHGTIDIRPTPSLQVRMHRSITGWSRWFSPDELQRDERQTEIQPGRI